jgi:hypothetical protein
MNQLLARTDQPSDLRRDLIEFVRKQTDIAWDHKYKLWPPTSTS